MSTTSSPTLTTAVLLLAAALAGCGGSGTGAAPTGSDSTTGTAPSTPTATMTSVSTSGELTDAEILWLGQFNRTYRALMDEQERGPKTIGTPTQMRAEAKSLGACGRALAGMEDPGPRLQSVYRTFTEACGHFDRAAECALVIAEYMTGVTPGSPEERKLNEASDCHSVEFNQGSRQLSDAQTESIDLLIGVPST